MTGLSCARTLMLVAMKNSAAGKSARMCQERRIELSSYAEFKARQQDHDHTRCVVQIHLEIFSRGCQSMQANIRDLLVRSFSNLICGCRLYSACTLVSLMMRAYLPLSASTKARN